MATRTLRSTCQPAIKGTARRPLLERRVEQRRQTIARQGDLPFRDLQGFGLVRARRCAAATDSRIHDSLREAQPFVGLRERDAFREVLGSEDAQTGVKAFLTGEKPTFSGS